MHDSHGRSFFYFFLVNFIILGNFDNPTRIEKGNTMLSMQHILCIVFASKEDKTYLDNLTVREHTGIH